MYKLIKTETGFSVVPDEKGEYETMESAIAVGKKGLPVVRQKEVVKQLIESLSDKAGAQGSKVLQTQLNKLLDKEDRAGVTLQDINQLTLPADKKKFSERINVVLNQVRQLVK